MWQGGTPRKTEATEGMATSVGVNAKAALPAPALADDKPRTDLATRPRRSMLEGPKVTVEPIDPHGPPLARRNGRVPLEPT
jgi:hypothetical protein